MNYQCKYSLIDYKLTGKRMSELINNKSIDVRRLANAIGVSNQAVYKWLNGQSLPSLDNFFQISQLLCVSIDDIIVCSDYISYDLPEMYIRENYRIQYQIRYRMSVHETS